MDRLATPWMFIGPSGSGKMSLARQWIETAHGVTLSYPLEVRTFSVGDGYEARVFASPYHFEIDIPNLSMQDKQIIGELLTMFLSSGDVLNSLRTSSRKLVILRRAHCLSLPAAIRVRAIFQQYVLPAHASGMVWMTAREMTGPLALLEDAFVRHAVPRMPLATWMEHAGIPAAYKTEAAWHHLEGRPERARHAARFFPTGTQVWPRRIQHYYDAMIQEMIRGAHRVKAPNMDVVEWLRGRVYEALSFCQTGPEIIDCCASAVLRCADRLPAETFWRVMAALSTSEPHTSYRTPLSLEWALLNMYEVLRTQKSDPVTKDGGITGVTASPAGGVADPACVGVSVSGAAAPTTTPATAKGGVKAPARRRVAAGKPTNPKEHVG